MILNNTKPVSALINGLILTMDKGWHEYGNGMILIEGNTLSYVGPYDGEKIAALPKAEILDLSGCVIIPGLINTHTHVGMSFFRGIADDSADRLRRVIFPLERDYVSADLVYLASLHSLAEMILGGTTCFADMYFFQDRTARAALESGIRAIVGQAVSHDPAPDALNAEEAFDRTIKLAELLGKEDRVRPAIAPHAPYTLTREELVQCGELSRNMNIPLLSHLAEMPFEEGWTLEHQGMRPVPYYDDCGLLSPLSVLAHCIFADEKDQELLIRSGSGIAHNPSANSKSGKGIAPAHDILMKGGRIGLGTDGPMSGNTLDLVHQFGIAAKFQKVLKHDATVMNPRQVLRMATMGGAEALHMEDSIGSLEAGKRADITVFSTAAPGFYPLYDPYSSIVYAASPSDVSAVIVDGRLIMKDRELLSLDTGAIREASREMVEDIRRGMADVL